MPAGRISQEGHQNYRRRVRVEAILAYGGACACCGEGHLPFLTFDHVEDDGGGRNRGLSMTGHNLARKLKREGWPPGAIQVLCFNCNCAKGRCPESHAGRVVRVHDAADPYRLGLTARIPEVRLAT